MGERAPGERTERRPAAGGPDAAPPGAVRGDAERGDERVRLTAWVHGSVQGVGFRWWTRARALELGLAGTATNLPDGRVEIVAEGPEAACRRLLELLRGPGSPGRVRSVVERWGPFRGDTTGFTEQ
jgi:acylphosphatase